MTYKLAAIWAVEELDDKVIYHMGENERAQRGELETREIEPGLRCVER